MTDYNPAGSTVYLDGERIGEVGSFTYEDDLAKMNEPGFEPKVFELSTTISVSEDFLVAFNGLSVGTDVRHIICHPMLRRLNALTAKLRHPSLRRAANALLVGRHKTETAKRRAMRRLLRAARALEASK